MSKSNLSQDIITQKFILELNEALVFENAGIERIQTRIEEISIPEAKQQMQHHLQESVEHTKKRLQNLITTMECQSTQLKIGLPLPSYPDIISKMIDKSMTVYEMELQKTGYDLIIENAEISCYLMLVEKAQMTKGEFLNAVEILSLNLKDE